MTAAGNEQHRSILQSVARRAMQERGLDSDFPPRALAELAGIRGTATNTDASTRDLRNLSWCSIDNDDSRDLDQLTVAEAMPGGAAKILVAISDVDAIVAKGSALDDHARHNTTSVYTVAETFPMLPGKLSTDLTSLNPDSDRLRHMRSPNWKRWASTVPNRRMPRTRLSGRSGNQRRPFCCNPGSGNSSMPSLPAHRTRARGSVFCIRRSKASWRAVLKDWTSVTGSASNSSARMWGADISTSREQFEAKRTSKHLRP